MVAVKIPSLFSPTKTRWLAGVLFALAASAAVAPFAGSAEVKTAEESLFVTVRNPITEDEFSRIKSATSLAVERWKKSGQREPMKIVFDFNPDHAAAGTDRLPACLALAKYIEQLHGVTTVAFVHKDVTRHTVLPVLACQEIVMGKEAHIGNVLPDADELPPQDEQSFYKDWRVRAYDDMARGRGRCPAIILKMLSRDLPVMEGKRGDGSTWWVDPRRPKQSDLVSVGKESILPATSTGFYDAARAHDFGLSKNKHPLNTRHEVAQAYAMPDSSLREDRLEGRTPVAWRLEVRGPLTRALEETVRRRVSRAVAQGANLIVVELECGGGEPAVARDLGDFFRKLKDTTGRYPVMTVAYVTDQARDNAAFLALGCSEIVMKKGAKLGDFEAFLNGRKDGETIGRSLEGLAQDQHYPAALARALADFDLEVYQAHAKDNPNVRRYLKKTANEDEVAEQDAKGQFVVERPAAKPKGQLLVLDANGAQKLGFSRGTVDDIDQLYGRYGLQAQAVKRAGPDWLDDLATFLRMPFMEVLLVMLGITCLILELKMPGIGLPGVIAALCFVLFFWAHAQLAFLWLAVLLFVLGLALIALEIFVTPGFAVLGVSGIVSVLAGLALATLERWPQTESEWVGTGVNVGRFGMGLLGAVVAAAVAARYLPNIPYANRLVLVPPGERSEDIMDEMAPVEAARRAGLLGAIGVTATTLRPSGMVRFGDEFIDVVAEGSYVDPGARVQVVEIEGNRIVVKEV